jgi:hypothetical protein
MGKFLAGIVIGLVVGSSAAAFAAAVAGDGFLIGWTINKDGEEICSDPYVWSGLKEIECD